MTSRQPMKLDTRMLTQVYSETQRIMMMLCMFFSLNISQQEALLSTHPVEGALEREPSILETSRDETNQHSLQHTSGYYSIYCSYILHDFDRS